MSYSDGAAHKKEIQYVNRELLYEFDKASFERYAQGKVFPIDTYATKVPVSYQYFLKAEFERNKELITTYGGICGKYIQAFRTVGQEFIACDHNVSQIEMDNLTAYCKMLTTVKNEKEKEDRYMQYGRPTISMNGEQQQEITFLRESVEEKKKESESPFKGKIIEGDFNEDDVEQLLKELDSMIGLDSVKEEVRGLVNKIKISKMREEAGFDPLSMQMHLVFTGNPGTGKTTVARMLAKIFCALGVLSKGQMVEVDRSGLVAGYVGQTAEKVQNVVEEALGGILFIDEAYSLTNNRGEGDFGQEAIDTLTKSMEDNKDNLIVIVAGYTNEMKDFIRSNPGLQSRFTTYIEFPDYEPFDLVSILLKMCKSAQCVIEPNAIKYIYSQFEEEVRNKDRNFGNARDVRNYLKHIMDRQVNRITKDGVKDKLDLVTIRQVDVEQVPLIHKI